MTAGLFARAGSYDASEPVGRGGHLALPAAGRRPLGLFRLLRDAPDRCRDGVPDLPLERPREHRALGLRRRQAQQRPQERLGDVAFGWGDGASGFAWRGVAVPTRQYVVVLGVATRVVPVPLNGAKGYSEVSCALTHLAVRVILSPLEDWYPHARTTSVARPFGKVFRLFGA